LSLGPSSQKVTCIYWKNYISWKTAGWASS